VLPPDIFESDKMFTVSDDKIRFGLVAVKNVGEGAIEAIIEAREKVRFGSLFEFCEQVDLKRVNKRVIEHLIKCGAFDSTGTRRSQMIAALDDAVEYGQRVQKERNDPQMGLFDLSDDQPAINVPDMPAIAEWSEKQLLAYEKESLGLYISGHPLQRYEGLLDKLSNANAVTIKELPDNGTVRMGGIVAATKTIKTKRGDPMAFVTLEDMHGSLEVVVFTTVYASAAELLFEDNPVLVQGRLQKDDQSVKLIADTIIAMDRAEEQWTASIHFHLDVTRTDRAMLLELQQTLTRHTGGCRAFIHLCDPQGAVTVIALPDQLRLQAGSGLTRAVNGLLGYAAVETVCSPVAATAAAASNDNGGKGFLRHGR
jgi:DNA polymerase-3 subunit alpha